MRVFADTNFLVSAFATRGLSADVFHLILTEHELLTGEYVLRELKHALSEKLKVPSNIIAEVDHLLRRFYVEPIPDRPSSMRVRDSDDRWVLASAINAKADVLLTGDKDLLDIAGKAKELKIVSPREFWHLIQGRV